MKMHTDQRGLTLIEIIIAIGILGILSVTFINLFGSGLKGIIFSGNQSKANYYAQQAIEQRIGGTSVSTVNASVEAVTPSNIIVNFSGGITRQAQGSSYTATGSYNGKTSTITTFIGN